MPDILIEGFYEGFEDGLCVQELCKDASEVLEVFDVGTDANHFKKGPASQQAHVEIHQMGAHPQRMRTLIPKSLKQVLLRRPESANTTRIPGFSFAENSLQVHPEPVALREPFSVCTLHPLQAPRESSARLAQERSHHEHALLAETKETHKRPLKVLFRDRYLRVFVGFCARQAKGGMLSCNVR